MSESKHTPGPWKYAPQGDSDGFTVGTDHFVVAGDVELACPPNEADARLIAAAPELLEALLVLLRDAQAVCTDMAQELELAPAIYQANRAIEKALKLPRAQTANA